MARKTPEERATAAVEALVAKRDKLQSDLNDVNGLLAKLGVTIGAPVEQSEDITLVTESTASAAAEKRSLEADIGRPKMAGEDGEDKEPAKDFGTLMKEAQENPDQFETRIEEKPEPDYEAIMNADQPTEEEEGLAGGDAMGPGRIV